MSAPSDSRTALLSTTLSASVLAQAQALVHGEGPGPVTSEDPLMKMLATPYHKAYTLSADGTTYRQPHILFGAPVAKIDEAAPYWDARWKSLDQFLAQEDEEKRLKATTQRLKNSDPLNKDFARNYKNHQDNCSKYKKIREIFGPNTTYHPNQLVAKPHMPFHGFCDMELMYHVACKISDLQILQRKGELAMDPFDFFRWRVGIEVNKRLQVGGVAKDIIRSVIHGLGGTQSEKTGDVLFRQAAIRAANYDGRGASYGSKKKIDKKGAPRTTFRSYMSRRRSASPVRHAESISEGMRQRRTAQQLRRAERAQAPSTYGGVNSFRAQRQRPAGS